MKKYIIGISGPANQGKTKTINRIAENILKKYQNALILQEKEAPSKDEINRTIQLEEKIIGIMSAGDPEVNMKKCLSEFVDEGCHIIICATRVSGNTLQAVEEFEKNNNYINIWATNYRSVNGDHDSLNECSANHVIELMEMLLVDDIGDKSMASNDVP